MSDVTRAERRAAAEAASQGQWEWVGLDIDSEPICECHREVSPACPAHGELEHRRFTDYVMEVSCDGGGWSGCGGPSIEISAENRAHVVKNCPELVASDLRLIAEQTRQIDEMRSGRFTYCLYCDERFLATDEAGCIAHTNACTKHPMFGLRSRVDGLELALMRHGHHDDSCVIRRAIPQDEPIPGCDCGLGEALGEAGK